MRAKLIKEWGGVGTSTTFGNGLTRGGQINRGGFGGSSIGGTHSMYTYQIKDLNRTLQPKPNNANVGEIIHNGNKLKGKQINDIKGPDHFGTLIKTEYTPNGALKYYTIVDDETGVVIKLDPTSSVMISGINNIDPSWLIPGPDKSGEQKSTTEKDLIKMDNGSNVIRPTLLDDKPKARKTSFYLN